MSDWPDDWFRKGSGPSQPAGGSAGPADPTVQVPAGGGRPGEAGPDRPYREYPPSAYPRADGPGEPDAARPVWPTQPPSRSAPGGAVPPDGARHRRPPIRHDPGTAHAGERRTGSPHQPAA